MYRIDMFHEESPLPWLARYNSILERFVPSPPPKNWVGGLEWFALRDLHLLPVALTRPHLHPSQYDPKWNLVISIPNYLVLFLAAVLFADRRDVRIEDAAGGMGNLLFYFAKLGFTNLSLVDDFSQVPRQHVEELRQYLGVPFEINELAAPPIIVNLAGIHYYPKAQHPDGTLSLVRLHGAQFDASTIPPWIRTAIFPETELFCVELYSTLEVSDNHRRSPGALANCALGQLREVLPASGMRRLCCDADGFVMAFCRPDKYDEFLDRLKPYRMCTMEKWLNELQSRARSVYSQGGEDGILEAVFKNIGTTNRYYVDIGANDGAWLSNTKHLQEQGWQGVMFDRDNRGNEAVHAAHITAENVNELLDQHGVPPEFDLLSLDIDGNDLWVWKALDRAPRVVIIEFNASLSPDRSCTIPYLSDHVHRLNHAFFGASFAAMLKCGREKGYTAVAQTSCNLIFIQTAIVGELPPLVQDYSYREVDLSGPWEEY